jgi:ribosomal protein L7/L12
MKFRKDERSQKIVDKSAKEAKALVDKANEQVAQLAKENAEREIQNLHRGQK